jgi:competence protein ComEA
LQRLRLLKSFVAACLFAALAGAADIPDGPGKEVVVRQCGTCHDLVMATRKRLDKAGWDTEVDKMVLLGAKIPDDEVPIIIEYMAKHFNPSVPAARERVNINTASATEIERGLALPAKEATAIVAYRDKNGTFKDWQSVAKVPGVDSKKIEAKKDLLSF